MNKTLGSSSITPQSNAHKSARVQLDGKFFLRGCDRFSIRGVTYGPFAPDAHGDLVPSLSVAKRDLAMMKLIGVNALRTYQALPSWFLELCADAEVQVLVDIPLPKYLYHFLNSNRLRKQARQAVISQAKRLCGRSEILGCSVGNEIRPDMIRWFGPRRVKRFLADLADSIKQADPHRLITYANYPPTDLLDTSFVDFVTFNVYLHEAASYGAYLCRLQSLAGDKPLVIGEIGMDTQRHSEACQAELLRCLIAESYFGGAAGTFIFSWTDDWYNGGQLVQDWSFGITKANREAKSSYYTVGELYRSDLCALVRDKPFISIVVCSYNGAKTLPECLTSLCALDYPNCEIIVVDDGSTDETSSILARFPRITAIQQSNSGLGAARNVGLSVARGSVIAYTDSDCRADAGWLLHLAAELARSDAAAVGGPNLTPEDGWLAACIGAAPGQPVHVLRTDQEADHLPGCNMAFRRSVLEAIGGFDKRFRKAGDDVDVFWRLQDAGYKAFYVPGAVVWHHRRDSLRAYFRQQQGYGEAEALLWQKHPERFNAFGQIAWRGTVYEMSYVGARRPLRFFRGVFATGTFQPPYGAGADRWPQVPLTLLLLTGVVLAFVGILTPWSAALGVALLGAAVITAVSRAQAARPAPPYRGYASTVLISLLQCAQPLWRGWHRCWHMLRMSPEVGTAPHRPANRPPWIFYLTGSYRLAFWSTGPGDRLQVLQSAVELLKKHGWRFRIDSGWEDWDLEVVVGRFARLRISSVQEDSNQGQRIVILGCRLGSLRRLLPLGLGCSLPLIIAFLPAPSAVVAFGAIALSLVLTYSSQAYRACGDALFLFEAAATANGFALTEDRPTRPR